MKTILITIYDGDTEKNILRSAVFPILKKANLRIIFLVKRKFVDYYQQNFGDSQVIIEPLPNPRGLSERIFYWVGWNTIPTHSIYLRRKVAYLQHHHNPIRYGVERILGFLGRFRLWREFLRWIYFQIPDDYGKEIFEKYKPDLLFAPNMFSYEDGRLLRQAKKMKIKTVTTVRSRDVLTTKAFTRAKADRILVFNEYNKEEAVEIGDYLPEQVKVIGFPQFDIYNKKEIFLPREEFFRKIGLDPRKKLILYASAGDWKVPYDYEVLLGINKAIQDGRIKMPVQFLIRFHPKYPARAEYLKGLPNFVFERPGVHLSKDTYQSLEGATDPVFNWTFTDQDLIHLANSIYHSDLTINTESTMTLDAAALDKPIILIGYDGFQKLNYWHSIRWRYDRTHFQYVIKSRGAKLAKNVDELVEYINAYLDDLSLDSEGRKILREKLIYKVDGNSGKRAAEAVLEYLINGIDQK